MVYYQKYRPQSLSEVVGQEQIVQTLLKAHQSNRLSHAYLFCGPRGVGKTSTARILAKMVNCTQGVGEEVSLLESGQTPTSQLDNLDDQLIPCNKCAACVSITNGSALDLIEIDAASNRGIDDIRELRDKIKLSPSSLKKKIYIIDEVHMLTNEAFNALLKTLEEPPSHCLFILATTEANKIPVTILSRVQRLDFKPATTSDVVKALQRVCQGEGLEVEEAALQLVAQKSDGAFRDGVKLLDQLSSQSRQITLQVVEAELKLSQFESINKLLESLLKKDSTAALQLVLQAGELGANPKEYSQSVLESLRLMLLIKHQADANLRQAMLPERYEVLKKMAQEFDLAELIRLAQLFQQAVEKMRFSTLASLPLEIAIIEGCMEEVGAGRIEDKETISVSSSTSLGMNSTKQSNRPAETSSAPSNSKILKHDPESSSGLKVQDDKGSDSGAASLFGASFRRPSALRAGPRMTDQSVKESSEIEIPTSVVKTESSGKVVLGEDLNTLLDKWSYILEVIKPYNFSLEAMLRQVKIGSCDDGVVVLKVPYTFHQRILESPRNRDFLESVLSDVLGKKVKVGCELDTKLVKVEDIANVEIVAADDEVIRLAAEIFNS